MLGVTLILVAVTAFYADETAKTRDLLAEQQYNVVAPLLRLTDTGFSGNSNQILNVRVTNLGLGAAINVRIWVHDPWGNYYWRNNNCAYTKSVLGKGEATFVDLKDGGNPFSQKDYEVRAQYESQMGWTYESRLVTIPPNTPDFVYRRVIAASERVVI